MNPPPASTDRRQTDDASLAPRRALTRERILRAALAMIDEQGLEKLSMRSLGASLGVEAMSLYNHVAAKQAILEGVVEVMLQDVVLPGDEVVDWRDRLVAGARGVRALALAHPHAFPLFARRPARSWLAARHLVEAELRRLVDCGFTPDDAVRVERIVMRYVVGFCLADATWVSDRREGRRQDADPGELASEGYPLVGRLMAALAAPEADELFEIGLQLIVGGLEDWRAGGRAPGPQG